MSEKAAHVEPPIGLIPYLLTHLGVVGVAYLG
jgi:hypothetical protein